MDLVTKEVFNVLNTRSCQIICISPNNVVLKTLKVDGRQRWSFLPPVLEITQILHVKPKVAFEVGTALGVSGHRMSFVKVHET